MSVVLHGAHDRFVAAFRGEAPGAGAPLSIATREEASALPARLAAGAGEMAPLRRLVSERTFATVRAMTDAEVLACVAGWMATGDLRLWASPRTVLTAWGRTVSWPRRRPRPRRARGRRRS